MSRLFNPETEATNLHLQAFQVRRSKGKPGVNVDLSFVMDLDADEFSPGTELPGRLKGLSAAAYDAAKGGDSIKHEVAPDNEGKLDLKVLVNDVAEDVYEGAALLRKVRLAATNRYVRVTWVLRVHMSKPSNAGILLDVLDSTAVVLFTPAQGVLPLDAKPPGKGKGKGENQPTVIQ